MIVLVSYEHIRMFPFKWLHVQVSDMRTDALAAARVVQPLNARLLEAAKFHAHHLQQIRTSQKVSVVVKELLSAKEHDNLRPRYLKDLRVRLNRFAGSFGDRTISDIS